jgi:hypothetical protein
VTRMFYPKFSRNREFTHIADLITGFQAGNVTTTIRGQMLDTH